MNIEIQKKENVVQRVENIGQKKENVVQKIESTGQKKENVVQKIESTGQKKDKKVTKNNKEQTSIVKNFVGKDVAIALRNGDNIKGKLETVAQYEILVTVAYVPMIIMKHAIDYITLAGEK